MKLTLENMWPQSFGEAYEFGYDIGLEQWEKIFRKIGLKIARAREEGLKIGREEGISEVAANLVRLGYETDEICRVTNLDRNAVEEIRKSFDR